MSGAVVVTGGAGFLGSHLCEALVERGQTVVCVDNLSTGNVRNVDALRNSSGFTFIEADVTEEIPVGGPLDAVMHLASPASPRDFERLAIEILEAGSLGTRNCLELARSHDARFVLASTSEVYGEPVEHPQRETSWGQVDPVGVRGAYDEAKRFAEALTSAYVRNHGLSAAIARIFNTYGPRMTAGDGRIIPTFISQALSGADLTIHGDGSQTRCYCYVEDTVRGLVALLDSGSDGPFNIGGVREVTVMEVAEMVLELTGSSSGLRRVTLPPGDPTRRRPDISRAEKELGWVPTVDLLEGLALTAQWLGVDRADG